MPVKRKKISFRFTLRVRVDKNILRTSPLNPQIFGDMWPAITRVVTAGHTPVTRERKKDDPGNEVVRSLNVSLTEFGKKYLNQFWLVKG